MRLRCPAFDRTILSRRVPLCGFCRQPLPTELLFSPAEIEQIEAEERVRDLARAQREETRAREGAKARSSDGGGDGSIGVAGFGGGSWG